VATIKVSKKRAEPDPPPYLWGFGVFLVGVFIVALVTLSIDQKPTAQQKQVAEIIVRLLKDPSTTGSGQFAGQ
jgi:hypothetical protein